MEKKWIWLILFGLVAALGAYVTWSGGPSAPSKATNEAPKDLIGNPDDEAPVLGGSPTLQPPVPGARKEGGFPEATAPGFGTPPPPGYSATPPNLETFAPPDGQRPADPPTSFDPVPPQAFENPDFVTPPPPPTQFDSEPVPFDDEAPVPPPQGFDQNGVPIQPQSGDYDNQQPPGSPEGF